MALEGVTVTETALLPEEEGGGCWEWEADEVLAQPARRSTSNGARNQIGRMSYFCGKKCGVQLNEGTD